MEGGAYSDIDTSALTENEYVIKNYGGPSSIFFTKEPDEYTSKGGNYLRGCIIAEGSVHTDAAFRALQAIGYHGCVALEGDPIGPDEEASFCKNLQTVTRYMTQYL